jgi:vacuolar protein sorting-associated protein 16
VNFEKLGKGAVSYADIAHRAWEVGRTGLATKVSARASFMLGRRFLILFLFSFLFHSSKLLNHETRASDQVPLLLTMKADKLALLKAADSGDT